jgi:hypothetical protein
MNRTASLLLVTFALATACSSPPYPAYSIESDAEQISHVVVQDPALHDVIRVGNPLVERTPGGNNLRVVVPLRNIDDDYIQILVQMTFQNGQKVPIGDDTNRQVLTIAPGHTINYECSSKRQEAVDYVLRLGWNN